MTTHSIDYSTPEKHEDVGVIVGRFQTPYLHEAHKELIKLVASKHHDKVVIFLGISHSKRSRRNPLDFEARRVMILADFPGATLLPLSDMKDDENWSHQLDDKILEILPFASVRLYGGRDSFITHYHGSFPTTEIDTKMYYSATSLRAEAGYDVRTSADWRAGVIYGAYNQYPKAWPTVDIAPYRKNESGIYEVLLARKPNEKEYRFIGGFVDPSDNSLETAARREVMEESGIEVGGLAYVCSKRIDDWRYKDDVDKVVTTLFAARYLHGSPQPKDDIEELKWFVHAPRNAYNSMAYVDIVDAHCDIFEKFEEFIKSLEEKDAASISSKSTATVG